MLENKLLEKLRNKNIITEDESNQILEFEKNKTVSIFWELRTLIFLGISSLSVGIGTLIYKNIDTIGHDIIIAALGICCIFSFYWVYKKRKDFTWQSQEETNGYGDYVLLAACLLFLSLEAYLQFQYNLFGNSYSYIALFPAVIFVYLAYRHDHRGVLSMGLTAAASFFGISTGPKNIIKILELNDSGLIITSLLFGLVLIFIGWYSEYYNKKSHFAFTYYLIGGNLFFLAALAGQFNLDYKFIFCILIFIMAAFAIYNARKTQSYLLLIMGVFYAWICLSKIVLYFPISDSDLFIIYQLYFVSSIGGIIYFLLNLKKILRINKK